MGSIHLCVVGDVAFSGPLSGNPVEAARRIPSDVLQLLDADVRLANLECVIVDRPPPGEAGSGPFPMHSPRSTTDALKVLGIDAVGLANNHILDYGAPAIASTIEALDAAEIAHAGAGMDVRQASRPAVLERNGLRLGVLAFGAPQVATARRAGALPFDDRRPRKLIAEARETCDFVVVLFHEGIEGFTYPTRATIRAAHQAVDGGADLVIGTHPHTFQGVETYKGVPIAYSLGNFILPMYRPEVYGRWKELAALTHLGVGIEDRLIRQALVLRATLVPDQPVEVSVIPIVMESDGLPRRPGTEEAGNIEQSLGELCDAFDRPGSLAWTRRDQVEDDYRRLASKAITWKYVFRNFFRIRPRHVRSALRWIRSLG